MDRIEEKYQQLTDCTCSMVRRSARSITKYYDAALRDTGIKSTQFFILGTLANTGVLPLTKLAESTGLDRTGLTRNLNILERNGWVTIQAGEEDSRQRVVSLSDKGYEQLDYAIPYWEQAQNMINKEMGVMVISELQQTLGNMNKVISK